jgi:hypothetical protein
MLLYRLDRNSGVDEYRCSRVAHVVDSEALRVPRSFHSRCPSSTSEVRQSDRFSASSHIHFGSGVLGRAGQRPLFEAFVASGVFAV